MVSDKREKRLHDVERGKYNCSLLSLQMEINIHRKSWQDGRVRNQRKITQRPQKPSITERCHPPAPCPGANTVLQPQGEAAGSRSSAAAAPRSCKVRHHGQRPPRPASPERFRTNASDSERPRGRRGRQSSARLRALLAPHRRPGRALWGATQTGLGAAPEALQVALYLKARTSRPGGGRQLSALRAPARDRAPKPSYAHSTPCPEVHCALSTEHPCSARSFHNHVYIQVHAPLLWWS